MEGGGGRGIEGSRYVVFALGVRLPATFPYFSTARGAFFVFGGRRVGGGAVRRSTGSKSQVCDGCTKRAKEHR